METVDEFGNEYHAKCKCGHPFTDHAIKSQWRDECQVCDCRLFVKAGRKSLSIACSKRDQTCFYPREKECEKCTWDKCECSCHYFPGMDSPLLRK